MIICSEIRTTSIRYSQTYVFLDRYNCVQELYLIFSSLRAQTFSPLLDYPPDIVASPCQQVITPSSISSFLSSLPFIANGIPPQSLLRSLPFSACGIPIPRSLLPSLPLSTSGTPPFSASGTPTLSIPSLECSCTCTFSPPYPSQQVVSLSSRSLLSSPSQQVVSFPLGLFSPPYPYLQVVSLPTRFHVFSLPLSLSKWHPLPSIYSALPSVPLLESRIPNLSISSLPFFPSLPFSAGAIPTLSISSLLLSLPL